MHHIYLVIVSDVILSRFAYI